MDYSYSYAIRDMVGSSHFFRRSIRCTAEKDSPTVMVMAVRPSMQQARRGVGMKPLAGIVLTWLIVGPSLPGVAFGQTSTSEPGTTKPLGFEVASIKPTPNREFLLADQSGLTGLLKHCGA
jgi:hypothetical protein